MILCDFEGFWPFAQDLIFRENWFRLLSFRTPKPIFYFFRTVPNVSGACVLACGGPCTGRTMCHSRDWDSCTRQVVRLYDFEESQSRDFEGFWPFAQDLVFRESWSGLLSFRTPKPIFYFCRAVPNVSESRKCAGGNSRAPAFVSCVMNCRSYRGLVVCGNVQAAILEHLRSYRVTIEVWLFAEMCRRQF